jgi:small conductance mechanosensitive channel
MERLTELFGFEARYVVYPVVALTAGGMVKIVIHFYLRKWAKRTESRIDDRFIGYLESLVTPLLLAAVLYFLSSLLPVPAGAVRGIRKGIIAAAVLLTTLYSAKLISSILGILQTRRENLQRFLSPLRTLSNVFLALFAAALILKVLHIDLTGEGIRIVRIVGIVVGALVLLKILKLAVAHMEHLVEDEDQTSLSEAEKRAKTLGKIINSVGFVLIIGVAVMMILSEFGMNIMPIITGAGIAGLAVGFGAQNLVRDVISGFFLILEDQLRVGDVVRINGVGGLVEAIKLRTTVLRDLEGVVHIFPNGEIKQVSNLTKDFSYALINVAVAYKENVDGVMEVLRSIGEELAGDADFSPHILAPLEIMGIDDFGDSRVTIKIRIKTAPQKQWMVGRELRRRIKNTFDSRGIEIPFPHVSVYFGEASKPFDLVIRSAGGEKPTPPKAGD